MATNDLIQALRLEYHDRDEENPLWAELGRGYLTQYQQAVSERNPEYGGGVPVVTPLIYGSD